MNLDPRPNNHPSPWTNAVDMSLLEIIKHTNRLITKVDVGLVRFSSAATPVPGEKIEIVVVEVGPREEKTSLNLMDYPEVSNAAEINDTNMFRVGELQHIWVEAGGDDVGIEGFRKAENHLFCAANAGHAIIKYSHPQGDTSPFVLVGLPLSFLRFLVPRR
jgi:hypothetical protein